MRNCLNTQPLMREEEQFLTFLRGRGLRATAERRALIREIFAQHGHFDADSILQAVNRGEFVISRATVYRNLELLVEAGLAHKVRLGGRRYLYEHLHSGQRHDHMACRRCGRMVEFVSPGITALLGEICRAHGFEGRQNQLQILGLCRSCAEPAGAPRKGVAPASSNGPAIGSPSRV
ncbi:MAG: Fur family transcriptional regulator [Thermoanaerobaculia bacterium]